MHIEPGLVEGGKVVIGYVTAAGVLGLAARHTLHTVSRSGPTRFAVGVVLAAVLTLFSFQVLPHPSVGVSEVHLILGSTLLLLLGAAPAAMGMAVALFLQGVLFEPADIPQFGMNVTTLLASLFATSLIAQQLVAPGTRYVDLPYDKVAKLSVVFQGSVVAWVAFWVLLGQGVSAASLQRLGTFAMAYSSVIVIEVSLGMAALAVLKVHQSTVLRSWLNPRLFQSRVV